MRWRAPIDPCDMPTTCILYILFMSNLVELVPAAEGQPFHCIVAIIDYLLVLVVNFTK